MASLYLNQAPGCDDIDFDSLSPTLASPSLQACFLYWFCIKKIFSMHMYVSANKFDDLNCEGLGVEIFFLVFFLLISYLYIE